MADIARVNLRGTPEARCCPPNRQNEMLGELQAVTAVRAADKVLLKSHALFLRQRSKQVRFGHRIWIDGTAITDHADHCGGYRAGRKGPAVRSYRVRVLVHLSRFNYLDLAICLSPPPGCRAVGHPAPTGIWGRERAPFEIPGRRPDWRLGNALVAKAAAVKQCPILTVNVATDVRVDAGEGEESRAIDRPKNVLDPAIQSEERAWERNTLL